MKTLIDARVQSEAIYEKAQEVIPGGVNSPVRAFRGMEMPPIVVERGERDQLFDVDGNSYIDYCNSWGALILGHAYPLVVRAVQDKMTKGSSFGTLTKVEEELARKVCSLVPSVQKIRFVSSGSEATMSAIRVARAYTGRLGIVKFTGNYHGHADPFLVQAGSGVANLTPTSSSRGVPEDAVKHSYSLPFNDFEAFRKMLAEKGSGIAAVILEPVVCNMGLVAPLPGFLEMLREETAKRGILLIFDEVITGFRMGLQGAQGVYRITPDLTCFGKIIGGGLPAAAFGGRADIMDLLAPLGPVYQAGTLSGNPLAMEAGLTTLHVLESPGFYERLEEKTKFLLDPVEHAIKISGKKVALQRVGSMFTLFFGVHSFDRFEDKEHLDLEQYKTFFRFLFERGIYMAPLQFEANFVSIVHSEEHLLYTRNALLEFLETMS